MAGRPNWVYFRVNLERGRKLRSLIAQEGVKNENYKLIGNIDIKSKLSKLKVTSIVYVTHHTR